MRILVPWFCLGLSAVLATLSFGQDSSAVDFKAATSSLPAEISSELQKVLSGLKTDEGKPLQVRRMAALIAPEGESPVEVNPNYSSKHVIGLAKKIFDIHSFQSSELAAHLYSIALAIDPDNVDLAYEIEVLRITKHIDLMWPDEVSIEKPPMSANEGPVTFDEEEGIGRTQSLIKGLLVQPLDGSQFAGAASQMNATAIKTGDDIQWQIGFNQKVGKMMAEALGRVTSYQSGHHELPKGFNVEISFQEQYIPKDGPSAAVACCLLLEALISDLDYDPNFAVTGDLDRSGKVGPVGGIDGKIRGAANRKCEIIAIPDGNSEVISDLLLLEGPQAISKIQIFAIKTFPEALDLALVEGARPENLQRAINEFKEIQSALNRPQGAAFLKIGKMQDKLRNIISLAPNHLSARFLLMKSLGKEPATLSLSGSLLTIDRAAAPLIRALEEGKFEASGSSLDSNDYADAISKLLRVRGRLDARTKACADSIVDYSGYLNQWVNQRPNSRGKQIELVASIKNSGEHVGQEYLALHGRLDVREELKIVE